MPGSTKKILLIDDSPVILVYLTSIIQELEGVGPVFKAGSYEDAMEIILKEHPQIVLLDIHLPGKNGIQLLRFIKETDAGIIVMMVTNQATDNYKTLCKKIGADYFFDKSEDFEKIPATVAAHLY
jgi:DNA-binding NarL/FixJ family response regulator